MVTVTFSFKFMPECEKGLSGVSSLDHVYLSHLRSILPINTLDGHLNLCSIDIPINTWLTLY